MFHEGCTAREGEMVEPADGGVGTSQSGAHTDGTLTELALSKAKGVCASGVEGPLDTGSG